MVGLGSVGSIGAGSTRVELILMDSDKVGSVAKTRALIVLAASVLGASALLAHAQGFPQRPVRLIVPFAPGGNVDITARTVSGALGEALGHTVFVENRAGASGMIGCDIVAKAAPDGYTLLVGSTSTMTNVPALYPKMPYDQLRDLTGVGRLAIVPLVIVVHPSLPSANVREFIALAKQKAGALTVASPGIGTTNHLVGELFQSSTGTRMTMVHYKGSGPALTDAIGGIVDAQIDQISSALSFIKAGKLRPLAVTSATRASGLPDVPTLAESGLAGFDASTVTALLAPAATPRAIIDQLNAALAKVLTSPAVRERFATLSAEAAPSSPDELNRYIREDLARWRKVVQEAGIKPE